MYHKSHASNTMGIYVLEMAFGDILEDGGRSIDIYFQISQSEKVRQRNIVGKNGVIIKIKYT